MKSDGKTKRGDSVGVHTDTAQKAENVGEDVGSSQGPEGL